jgi:hypothetical protein
MHYISDAALALKNANKSNKQPDAKKIVLALCPLIEKATQPNPSGNTTMVTYQIRRCPRMDACSILTVGHTDRGRIKFQDKTGFTTPQKHILSCVFGNDIELMLDAYWESQVGLKKQALLGKYLNPSVGASMPSESCQLLSKKDHELFEWVEMIVMANWGLSSVENELYRKRLKQTHVFTKKTVRAVIIAMTCAVEKILAAEMRVAKKGSLVHDAWSKFGAHYFALFTTYMATRHILVDGVMTAVTKPVISLLSVAPLHTPVKEGDNSDGFLPMTADEVEVEEAVEFTAKAHYDHIIDLLTNFYGIEHPKKWITNQTADSASVNLKLAKLLGVPHINCENHLLNNELKLWMKDTTIDDNDIATVKRNFGPGTVCKIIHKTMVDLKTNKNRAILRQSTDLAPTICNETRWASGYNMMNKWHKIEDDCELASTYDDATIAMPPPSYVFKREAKNTTAMLSDINTVAVSLQEQLLPLYRCRDLQDVLILTAEEGRSNVASPWHRNSFGKVYIAPDSFKRPARTFANAVCKLQKRQGYTLSMAEKQAIDKWLENPAAAGVQSNGTATVSLADRLLQLKGSNIGEKRKADDNDGLNTNDDSCLDHVIGSAAEVERLWSMARYTLTTTRSIMSPIVFEAILFLRMNRVLWDERTVMYASAEVRADQKDERLQMKLDLAKDDDDSEEVGVGIANATEDEE